MSVLEKWIFVYPLTYRHSYDSECCTYVQRSGWISSQFKSSFYFLKVNMVSEHNFLIIIRSISSICGHIYSKHVLGARPNIIECFWTLVRNMLDTSCYCYFSVQTQSSCDLLLFLDHVHINRTRGEYKPQIQLKYIAQPQNGMFVYFWVIDLHSADLIRSKKNYRVFLNTY